MEINFDTWITKDTSVYSSEPGKPDRTDYEYYYADDGHKMLKPKKETIHVYEKIQAERDSVDINKLMERFTLGDAEALNRKPAYYIDTRDMPKTYAEVFQRGLEAEQFFEQLPVELKEMFDNSYTTFYQEMDKKSFVEKIQKYNDRFVNHQFDVDTKEPEGVTYNE